MQSCLGGFGSCVSFLAEEENRIGAQMSYIPASDAGFDAWLANFESIVATDFATLGLTSGQATALTTAQGDWNAAYLLAINPATRTPVTVADKDVKRAAAEALARSLAMIIKAVQPPIDPGVLTSLGLTVNSFPPTPIPEPTSFPLLDILAATPGQHEIQYRDSETPTTKAKPYGVIMMEVWVAIGTTTAPDPSSAVFVATETKSPFFVTHDPSDAGKVATYFARWLTRTGKLGPWSSGVSMTIAQ